MRNIMVDLETLGNAPGCIIMSIGACEFSPTYGITREFHSLINRESCAEIGLTKDEQTWSWWQRQDPVAKKILNQTTGRKKGVHTIKSALQLFSKFINVPKLGDVAIWGNGSDFDNAILIYAYKAAEIQIPWKFYHNRCYWTLKSLRPDIKLMREGVYHNALDDAKTQARHALQIIAAMGIKV